MKFLKAFLSAIIFFCNYESAIAQVAISKTGTSPHPSAALDIQSADKGVLIPKVDTAAIINPAIGLLTYQLVDHTFYQYNGNKWIALRSDLLDTDDDTGILLDESPDNDQINFRIAGVDKLNLQNNVNGVTQLGLENNEGNIFIGENAGGNCAGSSGAIDNIGVGKEALLSNTTGNKNIGIGTEALRSNTIGTGNLAIGFEALRGNFTRDSSIAIGNGALRKSVFGEYNIAIGNGAAKDCSFATNNISIGNQVFLDVSRGSGNVAIGNNAGSGTNNLNNSVFIGHLAGEAVTHATRENNTVVGADAGKKNSSDCNTFIGAFAGSISTGSNNTFIGNGAGKNHQGSNNILIGDQSGANGLGSGNVFLGNDLGKLETLDSTLLIDNQNGPAEDAFLYGELNNDFLRLNGKLEIKKDSESGDPHLNLYEPEGDFIRLYMQNITNNRVVLAALPKTNTDESILNVYLDGAGNVMSFLGSNRVGINDTSPTAALEVDAESGDTPLIVRSGSNSNLLRVNNNGDAGIGGIPDADLHVYHPNGSTTRGLKIENSSTNNNWRFYISGSTNDLRLYNNTGSSTIGRFDYSSGTYFATSDRRAKDNFKALHFDWHSFMQLRPLTYTFKTDHNKKQYLGMIAQDVQEIYPELVNHDETEDKYLMNYSGTGVVAIAAIQSLYKENENLKVTNQLLEERLEKLEHSFEQLMAKK